jgi:outer membrane protein OmpA-like peptidoglycan-associated protein
MESTMNKIQSVSMTLLAIALMAGCNSTTHNASLADAHNNYNNASSDSNVTKLAPLELKEASDSLGKADQALSKGKDTATVNHLAYLANQKVAIAQETAKQKAAELAVTNANVQRTQTSLNARTAEADAANRQVARMQKTADQQAEELAAADAYTAQQAQELAAASANSANDQATMAKQEQQLKELNAKKTERGMVITLGDVLFGINKSELKTGGMHNVQKLADFLKEYPKHKVLIEGYTDSTGSAEYNQKLSERRANSVQAALVNEMGISTDRITARGYGKEFPVADNNSASNRQMNRRVEIVISDENGRLSAR